MEYRNPNSKGTSYNSNGNRSYTGSYQTYNSGGRGGYASRYDATYRPHRTQKNNPLAPKKPARSQGNDAEAWRWYSVYGVLEMHPNGYGFIRDPNASYVRQFTDPFVPSGLIEKLGLREGVELVARVQHRGGATGPRVLEIDRVGVAFPFENPDGSSYRPVHPRDYLNARSFDELTPLTPTQWLRLEAPLNDRDAIVDGSLSMRVLDLLTPIGKGQRALIVAPPRSGKTVLLQQICRAVKINHPDVKIVVLLIDERPEEVTDFNRSVVERSERYVEGHAEPFIIPDVEVVSSSLDCEVESHTRLARFVIKRCKSLVEMGQDVVLLLDSITRLARAFNKQMGNTGRTMTGGVDVKAMDEPKKFFAAARQIENGGSLTIIGTALIDTGSRMDELIFQEFKGTGNMELVLDRRMAERRVWPAVDASKSGTRREELLLGAERKSAVDKIRREMSQLDPIAAMERLRKGLSEYNSNDEFLRRIA